MILKIKRGEDFAFIDNEGDIQHKVRVSGNNESLVKSLDNILNVQTGIRFRGEIKGIPPKLITKSGENPSTINKSSKLYLMEYFKRDLELQGFTVEIIKA
ncbi:hypothetical protein COM24_23325 [Bacillus toyonensis]|uniref:hypothetical protein n=1 Tax=Bacillus toyonensis TaxID=155322 RepID=UPI000BF647B3|nr:hypothetical protein [Bacillus toyonensis]PGC48713.1 hypothetical protein COM24_23325 [Bacillus toyonensis]